jgi:hypothetical protein
MLLLVEQKAPSPDPPNHMISMASKWKWITGQGMKVYGVFMEIH